MSTPFLRLSTICLIVFTVILAPVGCTTYSSPRIRVMDATFVEQSDEAIRLDVALELENPNDEPLELLEFSYDFALDGKKVYEGSWSAEATLSATGRKVLTVPAVIRFDRLPMKRPVPRISEADERDAQLGAPDRSDGRLREPQYPLLRWTIDGKLHYITPGEIAEILLDTGVRKPSRSFRGEGTIALPGR